MVIGILVEDVKNPSRSFMPLESCAYQALADLDAIAINRGTLALQTYRHQDGPLFGELRVPRKRGFVMLTVSSYEAGWH